MVAAKAMRRPWLKIGLKMKMSGRCIPPLKGSFRQKMSSGSMFSPNRSTTAASAVGIDPRCPGSVRPWATSLPSASQNAVEKSMLSRSTPE